MLLADWSGLGPDEALRVEDEPGWVVQPKLDGVRALLHVEGGRVRVAGRYVGDVTHRLGEFQGNLPRLTTGMPGLDGTVLDGELVFPGTILDTGRTIARHPLQAATAILSTSPGLARLLQERPERRLRFHAFDVLKFRGTNITPLPLRDRMDYPARAIADADNPRLVPVPTFAVGRLAVHRRILEAGGEGTVWKQLDRPYEPGRRARHWIKRKRETTVEAFVSGFEPGTPGRGHEGMVGALEFSTSIPDGSARAGSAPPGSDAGSTDIPSKPDGRDGPTMTTRRMDTPAEARCSIG